MKFSFVALKKCFVYLPFIRSSGISFQVLGSRGDREKQIEKDTAVKINEIEGNVRKNSQQALRKLLDVVYDIKPELHENLRL